MSSGDLIQIHDKEAFPQRLAEIRDALGKVRDAADALKQIPTTAAGESGSFTLTGASAPIYAPLLDALNKWSAAIAPAVATSCDVVERAVATAEYKFDGMVAADSAGAQAVATAGGDAVGSQTGRAGIPLTPEQLANPGLTGAPPK